MQERKYVDSLIGDAYKQWVQGDKILISTPTGSGKTTFVINKLLRYAVKQRKHIVYYCNRRVLYEQIIVRSNEDIERFFANDVEISETAAQYFHIYTYQNSELKENYPDISIVDADTGKRTRYTADDILYYIFDEAHYFVSDALINSDTNFWYEKKFQYGISVFLTATPKPLMTLFEGWNRLSVDTNGKLYKKFRNKDQLEERAIDAVPEILSFFEYECKRYGVAAKTPSEKELTEAITRNHSNPLEEWFQALDRVHHSGSAPLKTYTFEPDYSCIDPVYFTDLDDLIPEIRKDKDNNQKWLILVDDERAGGTLATTIEKQEGMSSVFLSSYEIRHKEAARETYNYIIEKKSFPQKVLIATSVLDCGIDIISTEEAPVNNIVIISDNEASFLQMLGRRRVKDNERVRLFIKCFDYQTISNRYNQCVRELRFLIRLSLKNEIDLIRRGRSTENRDGNTYGTRLTAEDLDKLIDELPKQRNSDLITRRAKRIVADCNGHVKKKSVENLMNYEFYLFEYEYSKTAFLNLVHRLCDYRFSMSHYRKENENFSQLCAYAYHSLLLTKGVSPSNIRSVLILDDCISQYFPFFSEENFLITGIDCRSNTSRDREFYLKHQLSWIRKSYDVNCWLGFDEKYSDFIRYLDSLAESGQWLREDEIWHEQSNFAKECLRFMLELPEVPEVLRKDRSRYAKNPGLYPGKNKLENCFEALSLPYTIISKPLRYEGKKKTCWTLRKT